MKSTMKEKGNTVSSSTWTMPKQTHSYKAIVYQGYLFDKECITLSGERTPLSSEEIQPVTAGNNDCPEGGC